MDSRDYEAEKNESSKPAPENVWSPSRGAPSPDGTGESSLLNNFQKSLQRVYSFLNTVICNF